MISMVIKKSNQVQLRNSVGRLTVVITLINITSVVWHVFKIDCFYVILTKITYLFAKRFSLWRKDLPKNLKYFKPHNLEASFTDLAYLPAEIRMVSFLMLILKENACSQRHAYFCAQIHMVCKSHLMLTFRVIRIRRLFLILI